MFLLQKPSLFETVKISQDTTLPRIAVTDSSSMDWIKNPLRNLWFVDVLMINIDGNMPIHYEPFFLEVNGAFAFSITCTCHLLIGSQWTPEKDVFTKYAGSKGLLNLCTLFWHKFDIHNVFSSPRYFQEAFYLILHPKINLYLGESLSSWI